MGLDEQVAVWLANHGDLRLNAGHFRVEFLDAGQWVEVPWPDNVALPGEELPIPTDGSRVRGHPWPFPGHQHPQPGRYRIEWTATLEQTPGTPDDQPYYAYHNWVELIAHAYFDVHP